MADTEDEKERLNRKLVELLNELRVALPGVQVPFAFLLILPFSQGFARITDLQRNVYGVAVACAAVASLLLIALSPYHRHRYQLLEKEELAEKEETLITQSRLAVGGLFSLALAMTGVLFVIIDVVRNLDRGAHRIGVSHAASLGSGTGSRCPGEPEARLMAP